eukprot:666526-Lingulodinium_polyedra.AAC.1
METTSRAPASTSWTCPCTPKLRARAPRPLDCHPAHEQLAKEVCNLDGFAVHPRQTVAAFPPAYKEHP